MEIKSTKILNNLDVDSIFQIDGKVLSIVVISAYTDTAFIEKIIHRILNHGNKVGKPHFSIYLDYFASGYSSNKSTREKIDDIVSMLKEKFNSESGVYLVKNNSLFHSKCIVVQSRQSISLFLGSLNFTENGFSVNEELVLNGKSSCGGNSHVNQLVNQIRGYINKVSTIKIGSDNIDIKPLTLRQVLLDGEMYYEQKESDPFSFALNIPDEIRDINQKINPLLGAKINNTISLEHIVMNTRELKKLLAPKKSINTSWKRFCIETCYGFWSPIDDRKNLKEVIDKKFETRSPYYDSLFNVIENNKNEIRNKFSVVALDIEKYITDQKRIDQTSTPLAWRCDDALVAWDKWYERLVGKLKSFEFKKRIIVGIISAPVPNVWSDKVSAIEFEESFAENLQYYCIKGQVASGKYAARVFIKKYGLNGKVITNCDEIKELVNIINKALG